MNQAAFSNQVIFGLVVSIAATAIFTVLAPFVSTVMLVQAVIAGLALSSVIYLATGKKAKVGFVSLLALWLTVSVSLSWWQVSPGVFAAAQVLIVWISRSVYFARSLPFSLVELGCCLLAYGTALLTGFHTENLFLALWSFYLVLSLSYWIPVPPNLTAGSYDQQKFNQAYRAAESALARL